MKSNSGVVVQQTNPRASSTSIMMMNTSNQRASMISNSSLVKHYSVSQSCCFKKGIMTKQGAKVKNYKTRYFFLYSNKISYHKMNKKKEPNKTPQGEISLKGVQSLNIYEMKTIEAKAQKEGLQYGFIVEDQERSRNYFLFTETREETLEWIEAIRQVVSLSSDTLMTSSTIESVMNTSPVIVDDDIQYPTPVLTKQSSFETGKDSNTHLLHKSIEIKRVSALNGSPATPRGGLNSPRGVTSSPVYISSSNSTSSFSTVNTTVLLQKNSHESELTDISSSSNSTSFLEFNAELPPESFVQNEEGMSPLLYDSGTPVRHSTTPTLTHSIPSSTQVISDEDEYNIALNSAAIFLKDEKQRTPQEQAYVIGMHHFRRQMQEHIRKYGCKPVYNLAVGTVIFCIPEEERTPEEEEFYQDLMAQFRGNVEMYKQLSKDTNMIDNLTCAMDQHLSDMSQQLFHHAQDIPLHVQVEIVKAFKLIIKKNPSERTEEEEIFISRLAETHGILKRLYYKHGLVPNQITLIASILLDCECELYDNYYLLEERKKSLEENSSLPVRFFSNTVDYKYYEMKQGKPILDQQ